jgi:hypothetical protein
MTDVSRIRVSDADREQAASDLRDHYAAGRISSDELSDRLDQVYAAQTGAELDGLRRDLPELHPVRRSDPRRVAARRRLYQDAGVVVMADVGCVGIWAVSGAHATFWPAWVILLSALRIGRDGWRLFGPGGELETGSAEASVLGGRAARHRARREIHDQRRAERAARRGR